jgi:hypothetical protein
MRPRITAAVGAAVASAVLAGPAVAGPALTHQVSVTVTNSGCRLQLRSVSHRNTRIVFHVINDSDLPAGIVIYGLKSKFAAPKVGASDLIILFHGPGHYRYRCVRGDYLHPKTLASGVFTIRRS